MMVDLTVQVPDELAGRLEPIRNWLPTIIELSLVGYKTPAMETAAEIIQFLSENPSPDDVLNYHASERAQTRLRYLLNRNKSATLEDKEQRELDEIEEIEHIMVMLKANIAPQTKSKNL